MRPVAISDALALAVIALAFATGCESLLRLDDYSVTAPVTELPRLPALPTGHSSAADDAAQLGLCEACVQANCGDKRDVCLGSERCRNRLECEGKCDNPRCVIQCSALPPSPDFDDYFSCAFGPKCSGECQAGNNWGCVGKFTWDENGRGPVFADVEVGVDVGEPSGGRRIAACQDGLGGVTRGDEGCLTPVPLDAYSAAHLDSSDLLSFGVYRTNIFALTGPSIIGKHRLYTRPVPPSGNVALGVHETPTIAYLGNPGNSPARTGISFNQLDCLGTDAIGGVVELDSSDVACGKKEIPCASRDDCVSTKICVGFDNCSEGNVGGVGVIANVPLAKQVVIRSCDVASGHLRSHATVSTTPEWFTDITLYPMDAAEWEQWGH